MKLDEAIDQEQASVFEKLIGDINNDRKLMRYIEVARQEVFNYNRYYGVMIILKKLNDKHTKEVVRYIKDNYAKNYELKLNEIQAEIINGQIPWSHMDDIQGQPLGKDKEQVMSSLKKNDPVGLKVLEDIVKALRKQGIIDKFKKKLSPRDIGNFNHKNNTVVLQDDEGKKYVYNIAKKLVYKAKQEEV